MKKKILLFVYATCMWSSMITSTSTMHADMQAVDITINSKPLEMRCMTTREYIHYHKKELAILAVALTIACSIKYCSWVQRVIGIDTEAEIDDWRVSIKK